ncbi:hypothetical protein L4N58_27375 [Klebsiella pneumoniae]|uniref:hypothetical protein n=1 Tax=Klebsiella pneumoniae TaxID=573 RepID=UPI001F3C0394|nr:hypothetical protein [Klebsiella pneumoniae]MCF7143471.1 hypothetical protein [Klebsiella pneumoniae]MCF7165462.1 hypothetical protein [Klebsiella pneumoniae]MCF7170794.1 hypothetical protein [Klebsiella pneumoniae]MCF7213073.1 hypothetical protein [Klebsiella pneumoniae]
MGEISVKTGNNARNGGKNSLNRLIRCVCGKKIGPDPRNFNQRVSLGRNDLLIRTFPKFNRQLDTYRFKEKGIEVVMQRAASDDNSEAIMSFIMPDVNNMTLLVKNNGYIIVKTTCWLTKTDKQ